MKASTKCEKSADFFAQHLTKLREEAGLSKNALSELAGLSQSYLVLLEKGDRNPTLETLVRLAHGLGISLLELLEGIDQIIAD